MRHRLLASLAVLFTLATACSATTEDDEGGSSAEALTGSITRTPLKLTPTDFLATGTTQRTASAWGTDFSQSRPSQPQNQRSTVIWGRWTSGPCTTSPWGYTVSHSLTSPLGPVDGAYWPDCRGTYGPSYEADIVIGGKLQHVLHTLAQSSGPYSTFGAAGQPPSGSNKYIEASYAEFDPSWQSTYTNRMRPFGASYTDIDRLRVALRTYQSVTQATLTNASAQQLQQVMTTTFINEQCTPSQSRSYCQIAFNMKTLLKGVNARPPSGDVTIVSDPGQGGLIVVWGPINTTANSNAFNGPFGRKNAWTSWGAGTQAGTFGETMFQVEISWNQFLDVLRAATAGDPASVFGASWNVPSSWVLIRAGYGQENYNTTSTMSLVEGAFDSLEIISVAW